MEKLAKIYALFHKKTQKYYKRRNNITPSVWTTPKGPINVLAKWYGKRDSYETHEFSLIRWHSPEESPEKNKMVLISVKGKTTLGYKAETGEWFSSLYYPIKPPIAWAYLPGAP